MVGIRERGVDNESERRRERPVTEPSPFVDEAEAEAEAAAADMADEVDDGVSGAGNCVFRRELSKYACAAAIAPPDFHNNEATSSSSSCMLSMLCAFCASKSQADSSADDEALSELLPNKKRTSPRLMADDKLEDVDADDDETGDEDDEEDGSGCSEGDGEGAARVEMADRPGGRVASFEPRRRAAAAAAATTGATADAELDAASFSSAMAAAAAAAKVGSVVTAGERRPPTSAAAAAAADVKWADETPLLIILPAALAPESRRNSFGVKPWKLAERFERRILAICSGVMVTDDDDADDAGSERAEGSSSAMVGRRPDGTCKVADDEDGASLLANEMGKVGSAFFSVAAFVGDDNTEPAIDGPDVGDEAPALPAAAAAAAAVAARC